jgi:hypothetical protein
VGPPSHPKTRRCAVERQARTCGSIPNAGWHWRPARRPAGGLVRQCPKHHSTGSWCELVEHWWASHQCHTSRHKGSNPSGNGTHPPRVTIPARAAGCNGSRPQGRERGRGGCSYSRRPRNVAFVCPFSACGTPFPVKKPRCPRISMGRDRLCPEGGILPGLGPQIATLVSDIHFNVFEACRYLGQIRPKKVSKSIKFRQKK